MPAEPKLRCACCGSLARSQDFHAAGAHRIEVRRVLRGLGRGRGFEWSSEPAPVAALALLRDALACAAAQVDQQLQALEALPSPPCFVCGAVLTPDLVASTWNCSVCGAVAR